MIPVTLDQIKKVYFKKNVKLLKNKLIYTYIFIDCTEYITEYIWTYQIQYLYTYLQ